MIEHIKLWITPLVVSGKIKLIYYIVAGALLFMTYYFFSKASHDDRRKKRFSFSAKRIARRTLGLKRFLYNEKHEVILRNYGFPAWVTSSRYNAFRFVLIFYAIISFVIQMVFHIQSVSNSTLLIIGIIGAAIDPKYRYMKIVFNILRKRYNQEKDNEVYQLYNEIKAEFSNNNTNIMSSYHLISTLIPYYVVIRPTLEKMLIYLEKKDFENSWEFFKKEIGTPEAESLGNLMKDIEKSSAEEANILLEKRRMEFANNMNNKFRDYLLQRKNLIYVFVITGAIVVFLNVLVAFYLWYKDVMNTVNVMS